MARPCRSRTACTASRSTIPGPSPSTAPTATSWATRSLAVIDPGPEDDAHLAALVTAIAGRPVSAISSSATRTATTRRWPGPLAALHRRHDRRRRAAPVGAAAAYRRDQSARRQRRHGVQPRRRWRDGDLVEGDGWALRDRADARPHGQPRRLRARRHRHPVLCRPCHGLGHLDRRTAGRGDVRLHGLAGPSCSSATTGCCCPAMAAR